MKAEIDIYYPEFVSVMKDSGVVKFKARLPLSVKGNYYICDVRIPCHTGDEERVWNNVYNAKNKKEPTE